MFDKTFKWGRWAELAYAYVTHFRPVNVERSPPRFFYFAWFSRIEWWFVVVGAPEEIINKEKWGYTMIFCVAPKLIPPGPGGFWTLKTFFNEIVVLAVPWTNIQYSNEMYLDFYTKWAFLSILCFMQLTWTKNFRTKAFSLKDLCI